MSKRRGRHKKLVHIVAASQRVVDCVAEALASGSRLARDLVWFEVVNATALCCWGSAGYAYMNVRNRNDGPCYMLLSVC